MPGLAGFCFRSRLRGPEAERQYLTIFIMPCNNKHGIQKIGDLGVHDGSGFWASGLSLGIFRIVGFARRVSGLWVRVFRGPGGCLGVLSDSGLREFWNLGIIHVVKEQMHQANTKQKKNNNGKKGIATDNKEPELIALFSTLKPNNTETSDLKKIPLQHSVNTKATRTTASSQGSLQVAMSRW